MKNIDLLAGLSALAYVVAAVILKEQGVADLSEYIAQPQAAGVFALAALSRFYQGARKKKEQKNG